MNQRATLAQECSAECSLLLFPRWEHMVQDAKGKTPLCATREQVRVSEQSHKQLMDSFHLPPPCARYQCFVSDMECISFPPKLSRGRWPGQSVVQWEEVACMWELSGSLSWKEGNHYLSCLLPVLSGKLAPKVGHSQKHLKTLSMGRWLNSKTSQVHQETKEK